MIGRTLEGYRLVERIGQGGMGTVYRARDLAPPRTRRPAGGTALHARSAPGYAPPADPL